MIATLKFPPKRGSDDRLNALIEEVGALNVLMAAGLAVLRPPQRKRTPQAMELSDHLRRDIGRERVEPPPVFRGPLF